MGCPFWNGSRSTCVDVDVDRFEYDIIINSIKISSFLRIHLAEKVVWPMIGQRSAPLSMCKVHLRVLVD